MKGAEEGAEKPLIFFVPVSKTKWIEMGGSKGGRNPLRKLTSGAGVGVTISLFNGGAREISKWGGFNEGANEWVRELVSE